MGFRYVQCLVTSDLVYPLTKGNKNILILYQNMGPLVLHSSNQEYIVPIKYHIVFARYYLVLLSSLRILVSPLVTV